MEDPAILVVDDEASVLSLVQSALSRIGLSVLEAPNGTAALEIALARPIDVAIIDLHMPGLSGIETIRRLKRVHPETEIIVFTADATEESAVESVGEDVFDYVHKLAGVTSLRKSVKRALERRELIRKNDELGALLVLERELHGRTSPTWREVTTALSPKDALIGNSDAIRRICRLVCSAASTDMNILVRGESGTGKNVVARLVHEVSDRAKRGAFVVANCPAVSESLFESEMFGHERGSFTGAVRGKPGRFEMAANGTIFLDEIGAIPVGVQAKLLHAIEHSSFMRVGGEVSIGVNARVISATNAPLEQMVGDGRFRADLYYRLNQFPIVVPPLRDRREDIPLLVDHFLKRYSRQSGLAPRQIPVAALELLVNYSWPGNVRELEATVERFALTGDLDSLESALNGLDTALTPSPAAYSLNTKRDETEIQAIMVALIKTHWNQRRAAQMLGITYGALRHRISKFGLRERALLWRT